jgi:transposase-like protein
MSLPMNYVGVEGDCCRCNRRASIIHCPACGSFKCVYKASLSSMSSSGERVSRFKCSKCGMVFEEVDWKTHCEAPIYMTKAQQVAHEMLRTRESQIRNIPLTKREEAIAETLVQNKVVPSTNSREIDMMRIEWGMLAVQKKAPTKTVDEYIERRLKGETFV